jgi:hypothetical protein
LTVIKVEKEQWREHFSAHAHRATFGKLRDPLQERIDYALLCVDGEVPVGYVTVRELDHETVYWPYGGVFPDWHATPKVLRIARKLFRSQGTLAPRLRFLVEHENVPMLKIALQLGARIVGVRASSPEFYVEFEHLFCVA